MASIYIETSIVSYLRSRQASHVIAAARQLLTKRWWSDERKKCILVTSQYVIDEACLGDSVLAQERLFHLNDFKIGMRPCHHRVRETVLITAERDGYIGWVVAPQLAVVSRATWFNDFKIGMRPCHHRIRETVLITAERDGYIGWFDDVENTPAAVRRQIRTMQSPKPRRARTVFPVLQFLGIQSTG